jgi:dipeptidase E
MYELQQRHAAALLLYFCPNHRMNILAFSSSRVGDGAYLRETVEPMRNFIGNRTKVAFVPFASVDTNYEAYADKVREGLSTLNLDIEVADHATPSKVNDAEIIMVGGGNTFKLLHDLYKTGLFEMIRQRVKKGIPYIGWSAGSNIAGKTIRTTNDMPIIQPESFEALGFLNFQVNPHYYNYQPPGFNGETRDMRLTEFLQLNPGEHVMALPEGTYIELRGEQLHLQGIANGTLMQWKDVGLSKKEIPAGSDIAYLLQ